jgi:hypothetical protein
MFVLLWGQVRVSSKPPVRRKGSGPNMTALTVHPNTEERLSSVISFTVTRSRLLAPFFSSSLKEGIEKVNIV